MISTRRIVAAVGLAVGVTGFVAPMANAADASAPANGQINPMTVLDDVALSELPPRPRARSRAWASSCAA